MDRGRDSQGITLDRILEPVRHFWGFDRLRPLQEEAIRAETDHRDSVVVMPTGGGKSLCYQVPPVLANRTDIVVSPLISLMKDQVDGLRACGYPAGAIHSGMSQAEQNDAIRGAVEGAYRLLFVSPERILTPWFQRVLESIDIRAFAIDEAHCISHWGHDFRPEYRRLAELKTRFPGASVHAYTATATERVRRDVAEQLHLRDPVMLVGVFDRPNLVYRVVPRVDVYGQTIDTIRRHAKEAVIVYCLSRKDTESMADVLRDENIKAQAYHAGMTSDQRRRTQDAFADESLDVVTATVAFGMGIDRSNVRCIVHATMPKSVEHYQQETGRAGRDGLEAECVLLYSVADVIRWESLFRRSLADVPDSDGLLAAQMHLLNQMRQYCATPQCRHRALSEHFGQSYEKPSCEACDVCLNETEGVEDATVTAQKILSCVARLKRGFGVSYLVDVLVGANTEQVRRWGHDALTTYGLLKGTPRKALSNWVYQLVDLGLLGRTADEYPVLQLNEASLEVLRGSRKVMLMRPKAESPARTRADRESWEGVDLGLFEHLRDVRREFARERGVPAFVVFSDASLSDMARVRPGSRDVFRRLHGVGDAKLEQFGSRFVAEVKAYCAAHDLAVDITESLNVPASAHGAATDGSVPRSRHRKAPTASMRTAFELFATGASVADVAESVGRARSTVNGYLADFIKAKRPESIDAWVDRTTYNAVAGVVDEVGTARLRPIFDGLEEKVPYDQIRLVVAHLEGTHRLDAYPTGETPK